MMVDVVIYVAIIIVVIAAEIPLCSFGSCFTFVRFDFVSFFLKRLFRQY